MLEVPKLNLGSIDAINYNDHKNKDFFNKILFREEYLDLVLEPNKYFLIGEKGTGKTSYAVFLDNSDYKETLSKIVSLTQTDYQRFVTLTEKGKFSISSFVDIWKVTLLLLISQSICERFPNTFLGFPIFRNIKSVIDEYYNSSFRPEVDQSLDMVENSEAAAKIMAKYAELSAKQGDSFHQTFTNIQVNLAYLEKRFKEAIATLNLRKDFILFVDGIDIRPDKIDYNNYIECIKGLANAVWQLNTEFFKGIKDRKGSSIKVVILMRPDILDSMGFQNLNAKVRDNGIVLDWKTTYESFETSKLFRMITGILSKQQDLDPLISPMAVWKTYFPYELENQRRPGQFDDPFVGLLRYCFYRPRDIIQYLQMMQSYIINQSRSKVSFSREAFYGCQIDFSNYLLGEVKDYLSFYHSTVDFDEVVGFFSEFSGSNEFTYDEFIEAFDRYKQRLKDRSLTIAEFKTSADDLLQFLYSLNIVGYTEDTDAGYFIHYSFRDRTTVKLRPKVRFGLRYRVHPGLQRALLVGGSTTKHRRSQEKSERKSIKAPPARTSRRRTPPGTK